MQNRIFTILILIFSIGYVSAIGNTIPVQIQTTDALGNIQTGTYEFTVNISNSNTCSPVLYSNISTFTTDTRGIVSYDLTVDLPFDEQYYLCYYRDGVSKENKTIGTSPYTFRANVSDYWGTYNIATDLNNLITLDWINITNKLASDFNYLILSKWENITGRPTLLSNFSDDLGDRGYTNNLNFTNGAGYYNSTDFSIGDYIPYTGATSNVNLGANNFLINNSVFFVNSTSGRVGIGTTSPAYPLMVNTSVSGISIYAQNNISAEDYLYHSPFPEESYTNTQALTDLLKIKGSNGKINHSTMPTNTISIQNIPTYNTTKVNKTKEIPVMENVTYTEQNCSYVEDKKKFKYICEDIIKTKEQQKQDCKIEKVDEYVLIENTTDYEKIKKDKEVCTPVTTNETYTEEIQTQNGTREEPQTSVGMMLGNIVKSIQRLFDWNSEQDTEIQRIKNCTRDNSDWTNYRTCVNPTKG